MASPVVNVVNGSPVPYRETFRGDEIVIPGKGSIQMSRRDAVTFLGSYPGKGIEKMLDIELIPDAPEPIVDTPEPKKFVSMKDNVEFSTQVELDAHLEQFKKDVVTDEAIEKRLKKRK